MVAGLLALLFSLMVVIIVFLAFQVNENSVRCLESRLSDQDEVTRAARLILQSSTQGHPLFAHEHAVESKNIVDRIVQRHGGVAAAEKNLNLPSGKLQALQVQIYQQHQDIQAYLMEHIIKELPDLNLAVNEEAHLRPAPPTGSLRGPRRSRR